MFNVKNVLPVNSDDIRMSILKVKGSLVVAWKKVYYNSVTLKKLVFFSFISAFFSEKCKLTVGQTAHPPLKKQSLTFLPNTQIKVNLICHVWWEKALLKLGAEHFCQKTLQDMMNYQ